MLNLLTFNFFGGSDIFCNPFDGADESVGVCQMNLTPHKVFKILKAVLWLPAGPAFQMMDFSFKCLWYHKKSKTGLSYITSILLPNHKPWIAVSHTDHRQWSSYISVNIKVSVTIQKCCNLKHKSYQKALKMKSKKKKLSVLMLPVKGVCFVL